jgi:hypothetical protein
VATSKAATVDAYLAELPEATRSEIARVRDLVNAHLPKGYREGMAFGMITWSIPLETYPDTYNGQPLGYVALAAQKKYNSLYLLGSYAESGQRARLEKAYDDAGRRLDMGKSCLHFRTADELPTKLIGELIASTPPAKMIELAQKAKR